MSDAQITGETTEEKLTAIADLLWRHCSGPAYISYLEILTKLTRDPDTSEDTRERLSAGAAEFDKLWLTLMRRTFGWQHRGKALRRLMTATMQGLAVSQWMNPGQPGFAAERRLLVTALAAHLDSIAATK